MVRPGSTAANDDWVIDCLRAPGSHPLAVMICKPSHGTLGPMSWDSICAHVAVIIVPMPSAPPRREEALTEIEAIAREYGSRAESLAAPNEAETRLLIIDRVLVALGWSHDDFKPESRAGKTGYTDYLLRARGTPRLIVEAKRVGHTFGPPSHTFRKTEYDLRYVRGAFGPGFSDILEQATGYCKETRFRMLLSRTAWNGLWRS